MASTLTDKPQKTNKVMDDYQHMLALARIRIGELQAKIKDEFGVDVRMGVELELFGESKSKRTTRPLDVEKLRTIMADIPFFTEAVHDTTDNSTIRKSQYKMITTVMGINLCVDPNNATPSIAAIFAPVVMNFICKKMAQQYEVKFDNVDPRHYKFGSLTTLADSLHQAKATIDAHAKELGAEAITYSSKRYINTAGIHTCPSLHVNVSLWKGKDTNLMANTDIKQACTQALLDMQHQGGLMMLTSHNAYNTALKKGISRPNNVAASSVKSGKTITHRGGRDPQSQYLENRLPRASSVPELAILSTLAAMYEGLHRHRLQTTHDIVTLDIANRSIAKGMDESVARFNQFSMLHALIGPELTKAIQTVYAREATTSPAL